MSYNNVESDFNEINFNIMEGVMFVGREKELSILRQALAKEHAAVMLYGKRRVGKTTLIRMAMEQTAGPAVYYECIKGSLKDNLEGFVQELLRKEILPVALSFSSFQDAFAYLNKQPGSLTVVIDEYPYLKNMAEPEVVDSLFQSIIDNHLSNIRLVLSGSHIGMMKDLLKEGNALYGRFDAVLHLPELNYREAAQFYADKAPYDKAGFYGVFGGSPFINQALDPGLSLRENIIRTVLNPASPVYLYASQLLLSDYSIKMNAERIFAVLGNGRKRYSEIEERLDIKRTGNLSKQLKELIDLEIIHRNAPINRPEDSKKFTYEINDNLLRFFFAYVYRNGSALQMLGAEAFYDAYIEPTLTGFLSRRFEEQCRSFLALQVRAGMLKGVRNIGTYYYDDPKARKNGEFDVVLETSQGYDIYEVKYFVQPLELDEIHRELGQIRDIRDLKVNRIGFISINGFVTKEEDLICYEGKDLY